MKVPNERGNIDMKKQTLGNMIANLRKEQGMTQLDLAEKMGVTDKAVSKWERDLSCPDVSSIPKLAEILGVTVDELMQSKSDGAKAGRSEEIQNIINLILKAIPLAMGVGVVVLSFLKEIDMYSGLSMLGIGLACIAILQFNKKED